MIRFGSSRFVKIPLSPNSPNFRPEKSNFSHQNFILSRSQKYFQGHDQLSLIMNEITEQTWEFDGDDIFGDHILAEGIDDVQHSQTDDILLVQNNEVNAKVDNDTNPLYNSVPDDHFLLMQEPIVEDPGHEHCDLISIIAQQQHHHPTEKNRIDCYVPRQDSWTYSGRAPPESSWSFRSMPASITSFKDSLEHLANSLRQSEVTRSLIRHQMECTFDDWKAGKGRISASLSVDETRRSLLSLIEVHQSSYYASSMS
jgi:hypothetical protein